VNATGGESPRVKLLAVICVPSAVRVVKILKPDGAKVREWIKGNPLLEGWWMGQSAANSLGDGNALAT